MKNILILDDDKVFAETLTTMLDKTQYTVVSAENGEDGLKCMEAQKPDLILLDIKMPKMDGIAFLKSINTKYGEGKTPVLITSNMASLEHISEGIALGIRGYIVKSNESLQGLVDTIGKIFS